MYLMFLGPFQEGGDFRDEGITGIRRFLDKVWLLAHESSAGPDGAIPAEIERKLHQTIRKVTEDTERLGYNTAIAAMMEYVNLTRESSVKARGAVLPLVVMLAPFAPHLAEELWERMGHRTSVFAARWPAYDARLATSGNVEIAVQVNGKVRSRLTVPRGLAEGAIAELALGDSTVQKFVEGRKVQKTIYVQDRLLNLVV
jgi:leucyl-tRNA synthetase